MGTWSTAKVDVTFKGETPDELRNFDELIEDFVSPDGIDVFDLQWWVEGGISFGMSSPRLPNMEWQLDKVVEFFKQSKYKGQIQEITADVMEQSDLGLYLTEEDFE